MGAKRPLNGVRKCDGQTKKQTNRHTDISTYRKNRPGGPILRKSLLPCGELDVAGLRAYVAKLELELADLA